MLDATELVLGTLVVVLAGAAFALGGRVIRDAWRAGFRNQGDQGIEPQRPAGAREFPSFEGPASAPRRPDPAAGPRLPR